MKKKLKKAAKRVLKPRVKNYSDINGKVVFVLSILSILVLGALTYYIYDLQKPPNVSLASKEIFSKGMITVGVRTDLGSYSRRNEETGEMEGFEIDVCEEVIRRIFKDQILIRYEEVTSSTKLSKLNMREIDVCIGAFVPNSSKRITLNYSDGFFVDEVALVTRKDQRLNVLAANTILVGVLNDSYTDQHIEEYFAGINEALPEEEQKIYDVVQYACYQDLFEAVETFDADVLAASMMFVHLNMTEDLMVLPDRMLYHEYCFAFNYRDAELTKVFNQAIEAMKADGTLAALREKWNIDEIFEG
ncbi:MAG: transporter substrate-binding domain-containing protein [Eubacteriales bacterium]